MNIPVEVSQQNKEVQAKFLHHKMRQQTFTSQMHILESAK